MEHSPAITLILAILSSIQSADSKTDPLDRLSRSDHKPAAASTTSNFYPYTSQTSQPVYKSNFMRQKLQQEQQYQPTTASYGQNKLPQSSLARKGKSKKVLSYQVLILWDMLSCNIVVCCIINPCSLLWIWATSFSMNPKSSCCHSQKSIVLWAEAIIC